ncbi:MAG: hypothetical protein H7175_04625 [Burkholderiales bacterium]|nr:hypothetical protein [Anaerolineae bacterium]
MNSVQFPKLPTVDDSGWRTILVCEGLRKKTELRRVPTTVLNTPELTIYAGSLIAISREVKFEEWIAVRVGTKVGWLNTRDVEFAGSSDEESQLLAQLDTLIVPSSSLVQTAPLKERGTKPLSAEVMPTLEQVETEGEETKPFRPTDTAPETKPQRPEALVDAIRRVKNATETATVVRASAEMDAEMPSAGDIRELTAALNRVTEGLKTLDRIAAALESIVAARVSR